VKELGGQPREALQILTLSFEQGKPWCMPILSYPESYIFYACKCIMHLRMGFQ
jgi:hypothetical protein